MKKVLGLVILVVSLQAQEVYATFDVYAKKSANLAFDSSGTVNKIYVGVSTEVTKGTRLVNLNNDDLKASLNIAQKVIDNVKVTLKYAKKDYQRQLKIKNIIDASKFDKYELNYERAKVALSQARANYKYKKTLLSKTTLYAPFDGTIFEKSVEVGDVVNGMMLRTIYKIQSTTERKLILAFDQKYHSIVKVGNTFKYTLDGAENNYEGTISKIYPSVNRKNRKIIAEVNAKDFMVGLFGEGYIIVPDKE